MYANPRLNVLGAAAGGLTLETLTDEELETCRLTGMPVDVYLANKKLYASHSGQIVVTAGEMKRAAKLTDDEALMLPRCQLSMAPVVETKSRVA